MLHVYILENPQGQFYVGQTQNLDGRIADHNRTDAFEGHWTRKNRPWKLVWTELHSTHRGAVLFWADEGDQDLKVLTRSCLV